MPVVSTLRGRSVADSADGAPLGRVPVEWQAPSGETVPALVDSEQLHGRACVRCGSTMAGLLDAGHVYTPSGDGGRLGWPVKACPHHTQEAAA